MTDLQPDTERQADQETTEALRELIARELTGARERTSLLTDCVDETDLIRQHSPLLPPAQARAYGHEVRGRVLDLLDRARFRGPGFGGPGFGGSGADARVGDMFGFGMVAQHEVQHD